MNNKELSESTDSFPVTSDQGDQKTAVVESTMPDNSETNNSKADVSEEAENIVETKNDIEKDPQIRENHKEQDSKPELPPAYKEPKPIPGKSTNSDQQNNSEEEGFHDLFGKVLDNFVSANGKVNYNGLKANRKELDDYTTFLSKNPPQSSWSRNQKLAYWINAYNAFTLTRIIDNYPIKSIMDLDNGKTWDVKWIKIGNATYSLNNIENDIIRPKFNEPRIHFAVNCAAKSCPPLINKVYTADNLDRLLESNTKAFINNSGFNTISESRVEISKIFEWYQDDFGDLIEFINRYSVQKIPAGATINYKPYNWSLNN